jgi:hypothetical protein
MADRVVAMPTISLWQPWASLIFTRRRTKVHETRAYAPPRHVLGKRIAIHAAGRPIRDLGASLEKLVRGEFGPDFRHTLPHGCVIGSARLSEAVQIGEDEEELAEHIADSICGRWEEGRWAWRLDDPIKLRMPLPGRGLQGWWTTEVPFDDGLQPIA